MLPIDFLYRGRDRHPDAPALVAPERTLSYGALAARVDALAAAFQGLDPDPRGRVGLCAEPTPGHLLALLAILAAGKIWVPLNPRDGRPELADKVAATRPSIIVVDATSADRLDIPEGVHRVAVEDLDALAERHAGEAPVRHRHPLHETQAIKFTGGTSGRPKGVLQPYRAWITGAVCALHAMRLGPEDRYLVATPLTHAASTYITPLLMAGGALVFPRAKGAEGIVDAFAAGEASLTFVPPTLLYAMMEVPGVAGRRFPSLRHLIYGGAPMPPARVRRAQDVFGPVIATNYGQTEAPQMIAINTAADMMDDTNIAAVGRPSLLVDVGILDPDGRPLPPGEVGEVCVRGDLVMTGYLDMPEETAKTIVDGWLHTGDTGMLDARGFLFLKDRLRDVIITGGFNVYPGDVEDVLSHHPEVAECCVFGLPHDKWGEQVTAAVVPTAGATPDPEALIAWVKEHLGSVKAPKAIHVMAALPRNPVGKVLKREVRALVEEAS